MSVSRKLPFLLVLALIAIHLAIALSWMDQNGFLSRPPYNDASRFRLQAVAIADALHTDGLVGWLRAGLGHRGAHPPLSLMVAALSIEAEGEATPLALWRAAAVFWAVLILGTWRLARNFGGPWKALLATVVASACPIVIVSRRDLLCPQLPMAAFVIWALDALVRSDGFTRRGWSIAFGVFTALAALSKMLAPMYLAGSAAAALAFGLVRSREARLRIAANAALTLGVAAVLMATWYWGNWRRVLAYTTDVVGEQGQQTYSKGASLWSAERWLYYPTEMINSGFGFAIAVLVVIGLCRVARVRTAPGWILAFGAAVAFVLLVVGQVTGHCFYLPTFAPLGALAVAAVPWHAGSPRRRWIWVGVILAASLWTAGLSYRPMYEDETRLKVGLEIVGRTDYLATARAKILGCPARPDAENWPDRDWAARIVAIGAASAGGAPAIGYVPEWDHAYVSAANLAYEAGRLGVTVKVRQLDLRDARVDPGDVFLVVDPRGFEFKRYFPGLGEFVQAIRQSGYEIDVVDRRQVTPKAEVVLLHVHRPWPRGVESRRAALDEPGVQRHDVLFANGWRLLGWQVVRPTSASVALRLFWDGVKRGENGYELFVNLAGADDKSFAWSVAELPATPSSSRAEVVVKSSKEVPLGDRAGPFRFSVGFTKKRDAIPAPRVAIVSSDVPPVDSTIQVDVAPASR